MAIKRVSQLGQAQNSRYLCGDISERNALTVDIGDEVEIVGEDIFVYDGTDWVPKPRTGGGGGGGGGDDPTIWEPNPQWVKMPSERPEDSEIDIIYAIRPGWETIQAQVWVDRGTTTCDWGDGTIDNFPSSQLMTHTYNYDSLTSPVVDGEYKTVLVKMKSSQVGGSLTRIVLSIAARAPQDILISPMLYIYGNAKNCDNLQISVSNCQARFLESIDLINTERITYFEAHSVRMLKTMNQMDLTGAANIQITSGYSLLDFPVFSWQTQNFSGNFNQSYISELPVVENLNYNSIANINITYVNGLEHYPEIHLEGLSQGCNVLLSCPDARGKVLITGSLRTLGVTDGGGITEIDADCSEYKSTYLNLMYLPSLKKIILRNMPDVLNRLSMQAVSSVSDELMRQIAEQLPDRTGLTAGELQFYQMPSITSTAQEIQDIFNSKNWPWPF